MKKMYLRMAVLMTAMMMTVTTFAATEDDDNDNDEEWTTLDSLSTDTTLWYNQTQQLNGVVIKGRLPKTRVKGDAMRTKIAGTILEKAGTLSDALSKIPSLEAERDGGVKVMGRGEAEIYINGRRVQDVSELSRLRSDQILHVDVVQNPGARYAASTKAVVRITLKKAQGEGISFQDNAGAMYQYGHTLTNNLNVNYRTGGLDVTASFWAGRYGHGKSLQEDDMYYLVGQDRIDGYSKQETKQTWKGLSPQLQLNYMVNENHSFGAFYKYDYHPTGKLTSQFDTDEYENGIFTERSESEVWQDDNFKKHIFNAYYNGKVGKLGIDLNIDGLFDDTETPGYTKENATSASGIKMVRTIDSNTKSGNNFWASKLIFSYPLWKGNLSVGGEYSYNHRTDAYSYNASEAVYRRDIKRPAYSSLTSSTIYLNRYAYQSGNPKLLPTYTHSVVLNAAYKWMGISINYSRIKNSETMSSEPFPGAEDPLVCLIRSINTDEDFNQLSLNPYASPTIGCWHPTWYVYALFQNYKSPSADGTIVTLNNPYFQFGWDNTIELPKHWRINAGLRFNPKGDVGNFSMQRAQANTNIGIQRDFNLHRLGSLTLDLRCNDIFNTNKTKGIVYGQRELTVYNPTRRTFMVDLTWKFNEARSKYRGSGAGEKQKARM